MASEWTVANVINPEPDPYQTERGPLVTYWMGISDAPDDEGHEDKLVYWTRKPDSPAPHVGLVIFGDYTQVGTTQKGNPKLKFKPQERPDGTGPIKGGQISNAAPRNASSYNGSGPDTRSLRIERQHSQEMAIRAVAIEGQEPDNVLPDQIKEWTDYFCEDLDDYERSRQGLKRHTRDSAPDPEPESPVRAADGERESNRDSAPKSLEEEVLAGEVPSEQGHIADSDDIPFAPEVI